MKPTPDVIRFYKAATDFLRALGQECPPLPKDITPEPNATPTEPGVFWDGEELSVFYSQLNDGVIDHMLIFDGEHGIVGRFV